uniref:Putative secreted protein n=1 Tax=Ixodes ricinus TaxID=34613 RepID=A0A6B0UII4_IXORI
MQKGHMIRWASAVCIGACASSFTTSHWRARGSGRRSGASRLAMLARKSGRGTYYILCLFFKCLKSSRGALIVISARLVFCGMLTYLKGRNRNTSFSMARPFSY